MQRRLVVLVGLLLQCQTTVRKNLEEQSPPTFTVCPPALHVYRLYRNVYIRDEKCKEKGHFTNTLK